MMFKLTAATKKLSTVMLATPSVVTVGSLAIAEERRRVATAWSAWLRKILPTQRRDASDQNGGFEMVQGSGWCDGRESAYILGKLLAARCWAAELDADVNSLEQAIESVIPFILNRQHADGSLDLGGSFSANEAGFPVPAIAEGYRRLQEEAPELFERVQGGLKTFLQRAADSIVDGEAFTANHRWAAACGPLAAVHSLWPDPRYLVKIEAYLADGIDCDSQGVWYEERSPNYNVVANHGLMMMARYLDRPELLEPVVRNLQFTLYAMHPDGEADTSFSHRQDRGASGFAPCSYGQARAVALMTGDGRFTSLASLVSRPEQLVSDQFPLLYQLDLAPGPMPDPLPLPDRFDTDLPSLHASRYRSGDTSLTLAADPGGHFFDSVRDNWGGVRRSDDWFHLHHKDVVIQSIQLAVGGGINIQPATINRIDSHHWSLAGNDPGWKHTLHFRPGRPKIDMQTHQRHWIEVKLVGDQMSIDLQCENDRIPIGALNIWLRPGVAVKEGEGPETLAKPGEVINLRGGMPLEIIGARASILIRGLPPSVHTMPLAPQPAIPSGLSSNCARVSLGLRYPVSLKLQLQLA